MTTLIAATTSGTTTTPLLVDGYDASRASQNLIHDLISGGIAVTLIAPRPRAGTLQLVYDNESDAFGAVVMHAAEDTFSLSRGDLTVIEMTYVLDGAVSIAIDETRSAWIVSVGYQEVEV